MTDQRGGPESNGAENTESTTDVGAMPAAAQGSETVGTGSYIALSCSVMALLVTSLILGILFLVRWL